MENLLALHRIIMETGGGSPALYFLIGFLVLIGIAGQWMLYYKCDLPGVACIVPVWNVTTFLKIMGRPAWQSLIVMIPPPIMFWGVFMADDATVGLSVAAVLGLIWFIYMYKVYIELCYCFGRTSKQDYILVILLNGFYVLWLGLSDNTEYIGDYQTAKKLAEQQNKD